MIFITSSRKLHLFDNFWTFKTQNTEYNYKYVENCIYKKLKEAVEIYKSQTKNDSVLAKIIKVYVAFTPKCDAFWNSFFSLLSIIECYKPNLWWMFYFLYPPLHTRRIIWESSKCSPWLSIYSGWFFFLDDLNIGTALLWH